MDREEQENLFGVRGCTDSNFSGMEAQQEGLFSPAPRTWRQVSLRVKLSDIVLEDPMKI